jgi:D-glycero-D-manno-heptose 1,7-bisphosphate phosphatase
MPGFEKRKAFFLDRDGVLNRERGDYTWEEEDFILNPDVPDFLKALQEKGFLLIVITNQGGIGKGLYTRDQYFRIEAKLRRELQVSGVELTEIYYCPHHPTETKCLCRKPGSQLLEKAIARFGIDVNRSFMVGDRERDVEAAQAVGVKSFLIEANSPLLPILDKI